MKRYFLTFLCFVSLITDSVSQSDAAIKLLQEYSDELKALESESSSCYADVSQKLDEVEAFRPQHKLMLDQIRQGIMCDKCSRTKYEIDKSSDAPFEDHLQKVDGKPVPIPADKMQAKIDAVNQQLARLEQKANDQLKKCERIDERIHERTEKHNNDQAALREREKAESDKLAQEAAEAKKKEEDAAKEAAAQAERDRLEAERKAEEERQRKIQQQLDYNAQVAAAQSAQNLNRYNNNQNTIQNQQLDNSSGQVYDNARSMNSYNASSRSLGSGSDVDYSDQAIEDNSYSGDTYEDIFAEFREDAIDDYIDFSLEDIPIVESVQQKFQEFRDYYSGRNDDFLSNDSDENWEWDLEDDESFSPRFTDWTNKDEISRALGEGLEVVRKPIRDLVDSFTEIDIGGSAKWLMDKVSPGHPAADDLQAIHDHGDRMIEQYERIMDEDIWLSDDPDESIIQDAQDKMFESVRTLVKDKLCSIIPGC